MSERLNDLIGDHGSLRVSDGSTIEGLIQRLARAAHEDAQRARDTIFGFGSRGHNAGDDFAGPDDDSFYDFEHCIHPDCVLARSAKFEALSSDPSSRVRKEEKTDTRVEPLKAGAAPTGSTAASNEPSPSLQSGQNRELLKEIRSVITSRMLPDAVKVGQIAAILDDEE